MTTTIPVPADTATWQPMVKDVDLGLEELAVESWQERQATRGIIRDGDKIALLHLAGCDYYKLPGGGIEGAEDVLTAFQREAMEEVGCEVVVQFGLGEVHEQRSHIALYQTSVVLVANKVGGGQYKQTLTEHELEGGMEAPLWVTPKEALRLVEGAMVGLTSDASTEAYNARFIARRDQLILQEYLRRMGA